MQEEKQKEMEVVIRPGFRFYPTEEELVSFYLHNKLEEKRKPQLDRVIPVINIYDLEPWMLPKVSGELCNGDTEQWFFFVPRQEREARGGRPNRTTATGYWKATGSPSYVYSSNNRVIGVKKSMVFYRGKAPTGKKTTWKMNEYRAIKEEILPTTSSPQPIPKLRHELSLCRVYIVSGSFRAFDRRPLGPPARASMMMTPQEDDDDENIRGRITTATFSHTTNAEMAEKRRRRSLPEESNISSAAKDITNNNGFDTILYVNNGGGSVNENWEMVDPEFMMMKSLWD